MIRFGTTLERISVIIPRIKPKAAVAWNPLVNAADERSFTETPTDPGTASEKTTAYAATPITPPRKSEVIITDVPIPSSPFGENWTIRVVAGPPDIPNERPMQIRPGIIAATPHSGIISRKIRQNDILNNAARIHGMRQPILSLHAPIGIPTSAVRIDAIIRSIPDVTVDKPTAVCI